MSRTSRYGLDPAANGATSIVEKDARINAPMAAHKIIGGWNFLDFDGKNLPLPLVQERSNTL